MGSEVPAIGKEGTEVLRDSADAQDWQEAVKQALADEVRARVDRLMDDDSDILTTLHSSIELFQNNSDLVPRTKQFDKELADRFAKMAKPYELRVEGKLHGYSIPVQPLVEEIRTQIKAERAAKPAAAPAAQPTQKKASGTARKPQAGISSKAGNSADPEDDFSTLFGTLGMPDFRI